MIIETEASDLTRDIHNRMLVILGSADYDRWLYGNAGAEC